MLAKQFRHQIGVPQFPDLSIAPPQSFFFSLVNSLLGSYWPSATWRDLVAQVQVCAWEAVSPGEGPGSCGGPWDAHLARESSCAPCWMQRGWGSLAAVGLLSHAEAETPGRTTWL